MLLDIPQAQMVSDAVVPFSALLVPDVHETRMKAAQHIFRKTSGQLVPVLSAQR